MLVTVMLVTSLCLWLYDGDWFEILVAESLCWRLFSLCWWFFPCIKSVTNISNLSPTHFVSNIRHQHRCNHFKLTLLFWISTWWRSWVTQFDLLWSLKGQMIWLNETRNSCKFIIVAESLFYGGRRLIFTTSTQILTAVTQILTTSTERTSSRLIERFVMVKIRKKEWAVSIQLSPTSYLVSPTNHINSYVQKYGH